MGFESFNVLIIDPSKEKNTKLKILLNTLGIKEIYESAHYKLIGEILEKASFHFIFLGDDFLDSRGLDALCFLKKNEKLKNVPCFVHANINDDAYLEKLIQAGITGHLKEPADKGIILKAFEAKEEESKRIQRLRELPKLIKACPFFKDFSTEELQAFVKKCSPLSIPAGSQIISYGEESLFFYILIQGVVTEEFGLSQKGFTVEIVPGQILGALGALNKAFQIASFTAKTECLVLKVNAGFLHQPETPVHYKIFSQIARILGKSLQRVIGLCDTLLDEKMETPPREERKARNLGGTDFEDEEKKINNPFASPTGIAEVYDQEINTQDEYDVLHRKIHLRSDFILNKIPNALQELVHNKMYGYWTGGKLARVNPHDLWSIKSFTPGTPILKKALHLVILCSDGEAAFQKAYLDLKFSHRCVGLPQIGCAGTFLGSDDVIQRYFEDKPLQRAIKLDFEIPIDRIFEGQECIEFLTHTLKDVRKETLFLIFDEVDGKNTRVVREKFPMHQLVTIVKGTDFNPEEPSSIFTNPEEKLAKEGLLISKKEYKDVGFYTGQTFFLPDFSKCFEKSNLLKYGYIFATAGVFARIGPDYSGIVWGSKGGAEGAVKASRAMFGLKGAQSASDIAKAIQWADD